MDAAIEAAHKALKSGPWATMSARDRGLSALLSSGHAIHTSLSLLGIYAGIVLLKLADAVKEHEDELALLEALDGGFPVSQAKGMHIADAINVSDH